MACPVTRSFASRRGNRLPTTLRPRPFVAAGSSAMLSASPATRRNGGDGIDDFIVAGAATQVTGDGLPDLLLARRRIVVEQRFGRYDDAGRTEATLRAARLDQRRLDRVQLATARQSFDRQDLVSAHLQ